MHRLFAGVRYRVDTVEVEGVGLSSETDVERVANVQGKSIFRVRARELENRLGTELARIERASVVCQLPNRVVINLREHEGLLLWESGGQYWLVDCQGNVLGTATDLGQMILIRDLEGLAPDPQGYIIGVPWRLAQEMADALPAIRSYDYTREKGLVLYVTANEWPVFLGHKGEAQTKIALMRAVVDQLAARGIDVEYIDLRNEQRPTFKKA